MADQDEHSMYPSMKESGEAPKEWGFRTMDAQDLHKEIIDAAPKAGITYDSIDGFADDPGIRELVGMADRGEFKELADRITADMKLLGASEKDLAMIQYFKDQAVDNPGWRKWARDMSLWIRGTVRNRAAGK